MARSYEIVLNIISGKVKHHLDANFFMRIQKLVLQTREEYMRLKQ